MRNAENLVHFVKYVHLRDLFMNSEKHLFHEEK